MSLLATLHKAFPVLPLDELYSFVANVLLVKRGRRLAYQVNVSNESTQSLLLQKVLELDSFLTVIEDEESFLVLKRNRGNVQNILRQRPNGGGIAAVLGYPYRGRDWWYGDRYLISYVVRYDETEAQLYDFMVPMAKYNAKHEQEILRNVQVYNATLRDTGLEVEVICFMLSPGQSLEPLPLPSVC